MEVLLAWKWFFSGESNIRIGWYAKFQGLVEIGPFLEQFERFDASRVCCAFECCVLIFGLCKGVWIGQVYVSIGGCPVFLVLINKIGIMHLSVVRLHWALGRSNWTFDACRSVWTYWEHICVVMLPYFSSLDM